MLRPAGRRLRYQRHTHDVHVAREPGTNAQRLIDMKNSLSPRSQARVLQCCFRAAIQLLESERQGNGVVLESDVALIRDQFKAIAPKDNVGIYELTGSAEVRAIFDSLEVSGVSWDEYQADVDKKIRRHLVESDKEIRALADSFSRGVFVA